MNFIAFENEEVGMLPIFYRLVVAKDGIGGYIARLTAIVSTIIVSPKLLKR